MSQQGDLVLVEKRGAITIITINRPHARNAVDQPTADALRRAFKSFDRDSEAKVAILTGAGGFFCAGFDLKAFATDNKTTVSSENMKHGPLGPSRMLLSKPVIAAIAGHAVAGGFELALWCDLRVMEEDATLGVFCRRWGVPLIDGGTIRLPRLIGLSRALDIILTGRPVASAEAKDIGLAYKVVPKGHSLAAAIELAETIASFPQTCMRADRLSVYEQFSMPLDAALKNEFGHGLKAIRSGESKAGASRFAKGAGRHGSFAGFGPAAKL